MVSLTFDEHTGRVCGHLAMDIVQRIQSHASEADDPSSFRFHMATALSGAILILSTLLCRSLWEINLHDQHEAYVAAFTMGSNLLHRLAESLQAARRFEADLRKATETVQTLLAQQPPVPLSGLPPGLAPNLDSIFPYGLGELVTLTEPMPESLDSPSASALWLPSPDPTGNMYSQQPHSVAWI
jgi:hypothetical protein